MGKVEGNVPSDNPPYTQTGWLLDEATPAVRNASAAPEVLERIKRREPFRPFAPSILEQRVGDYFEQTHPAPTMLMVYQVREEKRGEIPAVTHVDGSGRLQTVSRELNARY